MAEAEKAEENQDAEKPTDANEEQSPLAEELTQEIVELGTDSEDIMSESEDESEPKDDSAAELAEAVAEANAEAEAPAEGAPAAEEKPKAKSEGNSRARWYIVHAYSGFEQKIAHQIREKAIQNGIADQIEDIVVPTEHVLEVRRGKKVEAEKKFFPGYLLVKMQLTDEAWHMVKNTDKVTGFLGAGGKPQRVPQSEVDAIFKQMEEGVSGSAHGIIYEIGETVKVTDGPFDSFTGVIEEVDEEREKVKVSVSIFGRSTPVELDYTQVQKT